MTASFGSSEQPRLLAAGDQREAAGRQGTVDLVVGLEGVFLVLVRAQAYRIRICRLPVER